MSDSPIARRRLAKGLTLLGPAARNGTIPHGSIEDGTLGIDRLSADPPGGIEELVLDLYRCLPPVSITNLLLKVDTVLGFTDAMTPPVHRRAVRRPDRSVQRPTCRAAEPRHA